jgi:hypothetical protein
MISAVDRDGVNLNVLQAYYLYGIRLRSHWSLPYRSESSAPLRQVTLLKGSAACLDSAYAEAVRTSAHAGWFHRAQLRDGTVYLRWANLFDFLVSADGREIAARRLAESSPEAFHTYLLGQALSFALIRQGFDPLHATTVIADGEAVAFLGDCGLGKSTLAAVFLAGGHRVLTDDLLVLTETGGGYTAHPGPPRIKLFPEISRMFLGAQMGVPITNLSPKLIVALDDHQAFPAAARLKAIYVLAAQGRGRGTDRVTIRRLSRRRACLELVRNTFNLAVTDPERLTRQFALATGVAASVPVSVITYARALSLLPSVREAILGNLAGF